MDDLCFDVLEELLEDILWDDYFHFLGINELTYDLSYIFMIDMMKRVDYYLHTEIQNRKYIRSPSFSLSVQKPYTRSALDSACYHGDMDAIKWMIDKVITLVRDANDPIKIACDNGHVEIVMYLLNDSLKGQAVRIFEYVCSNKYIRDCKLDLAVRIYESFGGAINVVLKFVLVHDFDNMMAFACDTGRFDVVKWVWLQARIRGLELSVWSHCQRAHVSENYEIADWLDQQTDEHDEGSYKRRRLNPKID